MISVFSIAISVAGMRQRLDLVSLAVIPYYDDIAIRARTTRVNHTAEPPRHQQSVLTRRRVTVSNTAVSFSVKTSRSRAEFDEMIGYGTWISVSNEYRTHRG
ncbi:MAG: hypothetical protein M1398_00755 [Deltaproteobacteria bacterium]|nr:hypothetical protein [Deltaproteobacteria bacterium]